MFFASAILVAGCAGQQQLAGTATADGHAVPAQLLKVEMAAAPSAAIDSVMLTFTVINDTDKSLRFVKWETPFEPRLGKYLEIKDRSGNEAPFKGAMARRVMPPPAEAYIEVPAHDQVRTSINVADNYTFSEGQYTIRYIGGGVSGLKAAKTVKVLLHK